MSQRGTQGAKRISAAEAAGLVKPGMWLDLGGLNAQPELFDQALAARAISSTGASARHR